MAKKSPAQDPFLGLWRIASMSEWDEEYLHEEVHAYIEFEPNGLDSFQFGSRLPCFGVIKLFFTASYWSGAQAASMPPATRKPFMRLRDVLV
jgi:hypothetical protein